MRLYPRAMNRYTVLLSVLLVLRRALAWTTLPDELLKTPFGYQVLSDKTPILPGGVVKCDTPFKCKAAVVGDSVGSCTICEAEIGIPASPYYGADTDVEVSPYDLLHLPVIGSESARDSGDSGDSGDRSSGSRGSTSEACPSRIDDEFVLPCCMPLRDLTGALTIKAAPTSLIEEGRQQQRLRSHRTGASETTKQEFVSSVLPCCGSGPSCCRWCKDICDDLEKSVPRLQRLWWSLCNGEDSTEGTEKDEFYKTIASAMYPRKTVGGGGMSSSPLGKMMTRL